MALGLQFTDARLSTNYYYSWQSHMAVRYGGTLLGLMLCVMAPALGAEKEFVIVIKNHQFIPAELKIPTGEKVRIVVDNQDDTPEEFESYSLDREKHIPAKSQVVLYIGPLSAGRYIYQGEDRTNGGGAALGVVEAQ
jgi:Cupredoxin-like domain